MNELVSENKTRTTILMILALLVWGLIGIHFLALQFFLYWILPWFDLLTHFWGGLFVGLLLLWLAYQSGYRIATLRMVGTFSTKRALVLVIAGMLVIGMLWEIYEYVARLYLGNPLEANYWFDTSIDMVMDVVGALVGFVVYHLVSK